MDEPSSQTPSAREPAAAAGDERPSDKDLSREIERVVERAPLDLVRCVRVFGNYYRCNWWARPDGAGAEPSWAGIIVDFIRKSRFLSAKMEAGQLVIKEVNPVAGRENLAGTARLK